MTRGASINRLTHILMAVAAGMLLLSCAAATTTQVETAGQVPARRQVTVDTTPIDPRATTVDPSVFRGTERRSVFDGVYTEAQATRGQATYQQACAACHLDDLRGDGVAPALAGPMFHFRWDEAPLLEMFLAIRDTMPQEAPASLSGQAYADICAYILKVNDFPAGGMELKSDEDALQRTFIDEIPP